MISHKHMVRPGTNPACALECDVCKFSSWNEAQCQVEPFMPPYLPHLHRNGAGELVYVVSNEYPEVVLGSNN